MKNKSIIFGGIALLIVLVVGGMWISAHNGQIEKKNKVVALQEDCKNHFDNTFKIVTQNVQMARENMDKSKEAFKEIFGLLMEERYKEGEAQFMKWVQESNPNFDMKATSSLYSKVMDAIESNRRDFMQSQTDLIASKESYDNFVAKFPNSIFVSSEPIEIQLVTSTKTEEAFETGIEDDITL
jgi:predicted glutamine amidotransferase